MHVTDVLKVDTTVADEELIALLTLPIVTVGFYALDLWFSATATSSTPDVSFGMTLPVDAVGQGDFFFTLGRQDDTTTTPPGTQWRNFEIANGQMEDWAAGVYEPTPAITANTATAVSVWASVYVPTAGTITIDFGQGTENPALTTLQQCSYANMTFLAAP